MARIAQLVVMGVSGSGKTTIATRLAGRLGCEEKDADDFHPPANIAKMSAGIPLDDADRKPWLVAIAAWLRDRDRAGRRAVVTCSALKRSYRDELRGASPRLLFVHLSGPPELIAERMRGRRHFMPTGLLASQLAILEPLGPDEPGLTVDISTPPDPLTDQILRSLDLEPDAPAGRGDGST